MTVAISQNAQYRSISPDWLAIKLMGQSQAADAVAGILCGLDRAEKAVFAARGMALILIEDRRLWVDRSPSMGQWIKTLAPNSWSDCYAAMRSMRELLPDVPLDDLKDMKRCNLETVKKLSPKVRRDKKVIEDAKVLPSKEFIYQTSLNHPDQHLDKQSKLEEAISMAMAIEGCSRKEAEEVVGESYICEHAVDYEHLETA
jgi:hypothetical protein